jgi:hypothetical protein
MNENHAKLMPSPEWAAHIQDEVLPQATAGVELGTDLLELGPGPGAATEWLRHRVSRLVAVALQDKVLAEAFRVLRPGGTFLGSDSLPSDDLHQFHEGDTYNPVEPAAFLTRLQTVGFAAITLHVSYNLVFTARKASAS